MKKKTGIIYNVPDDRFVELVTTSGTYTAILKEMGVSTVGGNFKTLKERIQSMGLLFSSNYKSALSRDPIPLADILVKGSTYHRGHLKRRLIKENILKIECAVCGIDPIWNGKKLVLILDHINGIPNDNELSNLRLVCPNCNSQLPTHAGRKNKKPRNKCIDCSTYIRKESKRCKSCATKRMHKKKGKNVK